MAKEIIRAEGLTKIYGAGDTKVTALSDVSLTVQEGEFLAVTGASGSGKSTLLNMLGGLDFLTKGQLFVDGAELSACSDRELSIYRRRKIGFVFQFFNLIPVLNVEENITMPLDLDSKTVDRKYLEELLEVLGIADRRYAFSHQLSGGQQQRVSIARALAAKPVLILADEPTGNLDSHNSREILNLLQTSIHKYHQTLIVVTHDERIAAQADRTIVMRDGAICSDSSQV